MAVLPLRAWGRLARRWWRAALAGVAIGAAALAAGSLSEDLWAPLCRPTFWLVHTTLAALGQEVVSQPAEFAIGSSTFSVTIVTPCSGYQGIGMMLVFVGAYIWLFRHRLRFPRALLLVPLGTVLIWLANVVRIVLLVLVGTWVSSEMALGAFHSQIGWLAFIAVALGLMAATQRSAFFTKAAHVVPARRDRVNPTVIYLAPLLVLTAAKMIAGAFTVGFDWLYPVGVLATGVAVIAFWRRRLKAALSRDFWSGWAVATGVAVFVLWLGMEWLTGRGSPASGMPKALSSAPAVLAVAWLAFRVVGSAVTVPIAEELAFRGFLIRRLISPDFEAVSLRKFTLLSFLVSSVLFGALHGRWLAGVAAGMLYATAVYRRGRIADAVVAHAVTNALIAAAVLVGGQWTLWI